MDIKIGLRKSVTQLQTGLDGAPCYEGEEGQAMVDCYAQAINKDLNCWMPQNGWLGNGFPPCLTQPEASAQDSMFLNGFGKVTLTHFPLFLSPKTQSCFNPPPPPPKNGIFMA
jgi:hypothetical protein